MAPSQSVIRTTDLVASRLLRQFVQIDTRRAARIASRHPQITALPKMLVEAGEPLPLTGTSAMPSVITSKRAARQTSRCSAPPSVVSVMPPRSDIPSERQMIPSIRAQIDVRQRAHMAVITVCLRALFILPDVKPPVIAVRLRPNSRADYGADHR